MGASTCHMPTLAPWETGITKNGILILTYTQEQKNWEKNVKLCLFHKSGGLLDPYFAFSFSLMFKVLWSKLILRSWQGPWPLKHQLEQMVFRLPAARESRQFLSPPRELSWRQNTEILPSLTTSSLFLISPAWEEA